jgi:hypothetical protein
MMDWNGINPSARVISRSFHSHGPVGILGKDSACFWVVAIRPEWETRLPLGVSSSMGRVAVFLFRIAENLQLLLAGRKSWKMVNSEQS